MKMSQKIARNYYLRKQAITIPVRLLGNTGMNVTAFGLGGQALLETKGHLKDACNLINKAIDYGVNYFDTATIYGPSRYYYGKALGPRRKQIHLTSKIRGRTYKGAKRELDETLELLNTDYIDLMLLHTIETQKDKEVFEKDGALRLLLEAKRAGIINHIGFSSHFDPNIILDFMNEFDFEAILMAINPAVPEFIIPALEARRRGIGVISMKVMSRGVLTLEVPAKKLLHYAMNFSDVAIIGCSNESDIEKNVYAASEYDVNEDIMISDEIRERARYFCRGSSPYSSTIRERS